MMSRLIAFVLVWRRYRRTLFALEALDRRLRADLGIDEERVRTVAWQAALSGQRLPLAALRAGSRETGAQPGKTPAPLPRSRPRAGDAPCREEASHVRLQP